MKKQLLLSLFHFSFFLAFAQPVQQPKLSCFQVPSQISMDQINNFSISNECMITSFSFQLVNRWGQVVRESNVLNTPIIWQQRGDTKKSKLKNKKQAKTKNTEQLLTQGVYFYNITFILQGSNLTEKQTGNLSIY
jgi:hypothetical protein